MSPLEPAFAGHPAWPTAQSATRLSGSRGSPGPTLGPPPEEQPPRGPAWPPRRSPLPWSPKLFSVCLGNSTGDGRNHPSGLALGRAAARGGSHLPPRLAMSCRPPAPPPLLPAPPYGVPPNPHPELQLNFSPILAKAAVGAPLRSSEPTRCSATSVPGDGFPCRGAAGRSRRVDLSTDCRTAAEPAPRAPHQGMSQSRTADDRCFSAGGFQNSAWGLPAPLRLLGGRVTAGGRGPAGKQEP